MVVLENNFILATTVGMLSEMFCLLIEKGTTLKVKNLLPGEQILSF